MSVFHHKRIKDSNSCVQCLEDWPCQPARIRIEIAAAIQAWPDSLTGNPEYDSGKDAGRDSAADLIGDMKDV